MCLNSFICHKFTFFINAINQKEYELKCSLTFLIKYLFVLIIFYSHFEINKFLNQTIYKPLKKSNFVIA